MASFSKFLLKPILASFIMIIVSKIFYKELLVLGINESLSTIMAILVAIIIYVINILFLKILSVEEIFRGKIEKRVKTQKA